MTNIYKALSDFQNEVPIIYKDTEAYGYKYADLPAIIPIINPILKKNGLTYTQLMQFENGIQLLKTILFHIESGEQLESTMRIKEDVSLAKMNEYQVLGSAITYYRRYELSAILGLVTDKDTDAHGEQEKKVSTPQAPQKPWLNPNTDTWNQAVDFLNINGNTLDVIKKKYNISKANEQLLINSIL